MNSRDDVILMGHGGGGALTHALVKDVLLRELDNPILARLDDAACLHVPESDLVFTTDSYVVDPVFFPGGDIGTLAVCGTINDVTMQGAEPRYLSLGLIIEEGFALSDLRRIVRSVGQTCAQNGVLVVTGDTKVIERRTKGPARSSGIFLNTTGIGVRVPGVDVSVTNAQVGDAVLISGTLGDHGIAVMSSREGLDLESALTSDVAPLWALIGPILREGPAIRCLRDPTRGGVAAALCDVAEGSGRCIRIREDALPLRQEVRGACGLLGLDPLNVANEGKAIVVCAAEHASRLLDRLRSHPLGAQAGVIGTVVAGPAGKVLLETAVGGERIADVPTGEDLPRIC